MGVAEAEAKAWLAQQEPPEPETFAVWPCNWPALQCFLGLATQWRYGAFGRTLGLDYAALPAFLQLRGIRRKEWPELFARLQAMEMAVLPLLNKR